MDIYRLSLFSFISHDLFNLDIRALFIFFEQINMLQAIQFLFKFICRNFFKHNNTRERNNKIIISVNQQAWQKNIDIAEKYMLYSE